MKDMNKLAFIQEFLFKQFGHKVDVYRQEGLGVLAVPHGMALHPTNVIYSLDDFRFENGFL